MTATYNFNLNQGSDLTVPFVLKDASGTVIDLTGYSAAMQLRTQVNSLTAVDTLTTANERITITPSEGSISCFFPHEETAGYPARTLVYDIELTSPSGLVTRVVQGKVNVCAEVTRV